MADFAKGRIVEFESVSGYICKGILYSRPENKITVIHIHGSYGNFYDNMFIHKMGFEYDKDNVNLLSFNLQTYGGVNDGFIKNQYGYYGGSLSKFETCFDDIMGAILFVNSFCQHIILQGHSLGSDKVLYFLLKSKQEIPFILLSPCDSYELQARWIYPETVEEQIERIKSIPDKKWNWLEEKEYGIKIQNDYYPIPITKEAFLSLAEGFNFKFTHRSISNNNNYFLKCDAFIYVGGKDYYQTSSFNDTKEFYQRRIDKIEFCFLPDGDHELGNVSEILIKRIRKWIRNILF